MIEISIDSLLRKAKQKKLISKVPENNVKKIEEIKKVFKKDKDIIKVAEFYEMLRKLEELRIERIGEFRKNVTLKIIYRGEEIQINLEKLKEYSAMIEKYIAKVKQFVLS